MVRFIERLVVQIAMNLAQRQWHCVRRAPVGRQRPPWRWAQNELGRFAGRVEVGEKVGVALDIVTEAHGAVTNLRTLNRRQQCAIDDGVEGHVVGQCRARKQAGVAKCDVQQLVQHQCGQSLGGVAPLRHEGGVEQQAWTVDAFHAGGGDGVAPFHRRHREQRIEGVCVRTHEFQHARHLRVGGAQ